MLSNIHRLVLGLREAINNFGKPSAQIEYERTLLEIEMVAGSADKLALTKQIDDTVAVLSRYAGRLPNSAIRQHVASQVQRWLADGHNASAIDGMLEAYVDGVKAALDTLRWPN